MRHHQIDQGALLFFLTIFVMALGIGLVVSSPPAYGANNGVWRVEQDEGTPDFQATLNALDTQEAQAYETQTAEALQTIEALPTAMPINTRTPTNTPTPRRATPTNTRTPRRATQAIVTAQLEGVSIRSGPGINYDIISSAAQGRQFEATGRTNDCGWLRIPLEDGSLGWITGNSTFISLSVPCATLPIVNVSPARAAPALPTSTPRSASPTARPALPAPTSRPQAPAPVAPAPPANVPAGMVTSFEPLGNWPRGNEPYGTFTQSTAQVAHGNASAQLAYDFPAAAGGKSYVVFLAQPALPLGNAQTLQIQVYGDGSGHILNAWVRDAGGQIWQTTFGFIKHVGWAPMSATLSASREWPNGPIDASGDQLTPPFSLYALVLDGVPDGAASAGSIYLDALTTGGGVAVSPASGAGDTGSTALTAPEPAAPAEATPTEAAPAEAAPAVVPSGPLSGKIAFSRFNGNTMDTLVYDVTAGHIIANHSNVRQPDLTGGRLLVNGDGGGNESITRMTIGGDNRQPVTLNTEDSFPQWSPSEVSLVYSSAKGGDRKSRLYFQADVSVEQDVSPILYNGREVFGDYPVYLDNWRIAFQGCDSWAGGSRCGIYAGDTRGGAPIRLTEQTSDIPSGNLGSDVIFSTPRAGNWDVWIVGAAGGEPRQLTTDPAIDGLGVASPDKTSIAFVSNRGGAWAVWVMNVDGSNQRKLFDIEGSYGSGSYDWIRERISWSQ